MTTKFGKIRNNNHSALDITVKRKIMISNLSLSKFFNALIDTDDTLLLCKQYGIYNGAYGNDLCDWGILIKEDNGLLICRIFALEIRKQNV